MKFKKSNIKLYTAITSFCFSLVFSNQVQLITTHKKNNGTLLRIVTSKILEIENIAGWKGQENWFYITLNGTRLSPSSRDYITFEPPLIDIEITENNESVQLGYLFEKTSKEMSSLQQRLESAYDDMGTVLNRYYKIGEALREDEYTAGISDGEAGISLDEDEYTAGISDGSAGVSLEEDQYTAGVSDYGPAFDDHMTAKKSKRLK